MNLALKRRVYLYTNLIKMEFTGRIIQKLELQKGTSARGEWKKQEFIVETIEDKFPKKVCVTAWAEKVDDLNRFAINDVVKLSINIESREYNGRWYTDIRFWRIEPSNGAQSGPAQDNFGQAPVMEEFGNNENVDDLPF